MQIMSIEEYLALFASRLSEYNFVVKESIQKEFTPNNKYVIMNYSNSSSILIKSGYELTRTTQFIDMFVETKIGKFELEKNIKQVKSCMNESQSIQVTQLTESINNIDVHHIVFRVELLTYN